MFLCLFCVHACVCVFYMCDDNSISSVKIFVCADIRLHLLLFRLALNFFYIILRQLQISLVTDCPVKLSDVRKCNYLAVQTLCQNHLHIKENWKCPSHFLVELHLKQVFSLIFTPLLQFSEVISSNSLSNTGFRSPCIP